MAATDPKNGKPPKDLTDLRDKVGREKLAATIKANLQPVDMSASSSVSVDTSPRNNSALPPTEFAEFVEDARRAFAGDPANPTNSANAGVGDEQPAIFPADSILADWMNLACRQEESADAFLIGSILPVTAGLLARRVWFPWGTRRKYPNLFAMLAGKPGDRKSSVILTAERLARECLPGNAFLPAAFSPEALFGEYAEEDGGRPDKLWIADDANATLKDWQKTVNGERNATRFLELYDCKPLSESFQRNRKENADGQARRTIDETSTSLLFGATFNIAAFQGQEVRAGMARRFLYYVAERHGRLIVRPGNGDAEAFGRLVESFRRLLEPTGEMDFSAEAAGVWESYQHANRATIFNLDASREAELSRLSSAPMQTLSVAMVFEACRWAKNGGSWTGLIHADTLKLAAKHMGACLEAAERLDCVAHRAELRQDAEILLARVRHDFPTASGFHFAGRSELTKRYCANSGRPGAWKPDDLYLRFIPALERLGEARLIRKEGKREVFAFCAEKLGA